MSSSLFTPISKCWSPEFLTFPSSSSLSESSAPIMDTILSVTLDLLSLMISDSESILVKISCYVVFFCSNFYSICAPILSSTWISFWSRTLIVLEAPWYNVLPYLVEPYSMVCSTLINYLSRAFKAGVTVDCTFIEALRTYSYISGFIIGVA